MDKTRSTRGKYSDLYSELAAVQPPSPDEVAAARRTVAAAAHDAADLAELLDALGIGPQADGRCEARWTYPGGLSA